MKLFTSYINRKITIGIWSIEVFNSDKLINEPLYKGNLSGPTIQASDVTDVPAEFVADPFLIFHKGKFYMFFEVFDKSAKKGIISLATSENGKQWSYEKTVLKENYHLSYPYVFQHNDDFYMIPESVAANGVFLYKAKNFPFEWEIECKLIDGRYVDSSIFQYNNKWWLLAGQNGKLNLFYSDKPDGIWHEHPKNPLISDNFNVTRPGGRVIVNEGEIYRYTQDGLPHYGSAVRAFKVTKLSEVEYIEAEVNLVLYGSNNENDWRRDGMHNIDQLKIENDKWLVAVDGQKLVVKHYIPRKFDYMLARLSTFKVLGGTFLKK